MDWAQLFINLTVTGILLYVFQRVIDERSAKRLEKFKTELQSIAFENETRFSKLHEKRAEVIAELYKQLARVHGLLLSLRNILYDPNLEKERFDKKDEAISDALFEFRSYFDENQIYLSESLCLMIRTFWDNSVRTSIILGAAGLNRRGTSSNKISEKTFREDLLEGSSLLEEKIQPLRAEIEREFKKLIGNFDIK